MPTDSQVLDQVENWSGKRPTKMSQSLEDWWNQTAPGSNHSTLPFDPDGIQDLVTRVDRAFPDADPIETEDLGSSGSIKTVQDLADALNQPVAKEVPALAAAKKKAPARKKKATAAKKKTPAKKAAKKSATKKPSKASMAKRGRKGSPKGKKSR